MNTGRRFVLGCALCAVSGLVATRAGAQAPGFTRKVIRQIDGPTPGYTTYIVQIDLEPGALVARHTHPGIESTYFTEGGGELRIDGQPPQQIKPGDAFQIPAATVHALTNGDKPSRAVANFILETGKPLATPA